MRISDWSSDVCASDLPAQLEREAAARRQYARFEVEVREVEAPTARLSTAMLAHQAVEPAFESAGQRKIGAVDRQDEAAIENRSEERRGGEEWVRRCRSGWWPKH